MPRQARGTGAGWPATVDRATRITHGEPREIRLANPARDDRRGGTFSAEGPRRQSTIPDKPAPPRGDPGHDAAMGSELNALCISHSATMPRDQPPLSAGQLSQQGHLVHAAQLPAR